MRKKPILFSILFLSGLFVLPNVSVFASGTPVINEFDSNPPGNDNYLSVEEWVELYNPTSNILDIGNWIVTTGSRSITETIPEGTWIEPGEYYVVSRGSGWLVNAEESLILRNALGEEIDRTPVKNDYDNDASSWSRYPNGQDSDTDADWAYQPSTRGEPNSVDVSIPTLCTSLPLDVNVTVHFIDVGQGDSIFVDTPNHDMLIDGGFKGDGGDAVLAYLQNLGITRIDYIVASHMDGDHIGGLIRVLKDYDENHAPTVIDNNDVPSSIYSSYIELRDDREHIVAFRGYSFLLDDCVNVTVLNPVIPLEFRESGSISKSLARNENSVVLRIVVGEIVFLLTGDAGVLAEESMSIAEMDVGAIVLKVGHHGSEHSTSTEFLNDVDPEVAVICVGEGNNHGHPRDSIITRLQNISVEITRTDQNGNIVITTDGTGYKVFTQKIVHEVSGRDDTALARTIAIGMLITELFLVFSRPRR
jgi:beta-lactamase superfamily II metal-dependent hydrolase